MAQRKMWFMKQIIMLKLDNPNTFPMVLMHMKDIYMVFDNILPVKMASVPSSV